MRPRVAFVVNSGLSVEFSRRAVHNFVTMTQKTDKDIQGIEGNVLAVSKETNLAKRRVRNSFGEKKKEFLVVSSFARVFSHGEI